MSIIHVMPSMTSPLPMRRAISIMFALACGARSNFMNSRIASWPSVVAPSFIISAHMAAGSLDVSDTCFSAAIAAPASKSTTAKPATARIVTYFIAVPPLEPCPGSVPDIRAPKRTRPSLIGGFVAEATSALGERRRTGSERCDRLLGSAQSRQTDGPSGCCFGGEVWNPADGDQGDRVGRRGGRRARRSRLAASDLVFARDAEAVWVGGSR